MIPTNQRRSALFASLKVSQARHFLSTIQSAKVIFEELEVWFDPVARAGPEAMAVDEWLLLTRKIPLLRIYGWDGKWGSIGYFGCLDEARKRMPGLLWVRRWSGGGVVDHSEDWTYSLIVPKGHAFSELKGGESYRRIHEVLVKVLDAEVGAVSLSTSGGESRGACFDNSVEHDVEDSNGAKLAGAAQRRGGFGLLHQGSVLCAGGDSRLRGEIFSESLSKSWSEKEIFVDEQRVAELVEKKYGARSWLERR